jgi:excisionase family DNA binding protein
VSRVFYSPEQVAEILGLHVRTVRGYVRDGRLRAVRVGTRYRISDADLRAFTGAPSDEPVGTLRAQVSAVVHLDEVGRTAMDRITTHLTAASTGDPDRGGHLDVHATYDETARRLTVFVTGDLPRASALLDLIEVLSRQVAP